MDEPDWVTWRWSLAIVGAGTLVGLRWWFDTPDLVWVPLPFLVLLAVPRLRTAPGQPLSLPSLVLQHVPAAVLAVLLVRAVRAGEGVPDTLLVVILGGMLAVGLVHAIWLGRHHPDGAVAGAALLLGVWCCVLVASGAVDGVEEAPLLAEDALLVQVVLLSVGFDLVSTLSRTWRDDTWLVPSLLLGAMLVGAGLLTLADGASPMVGALILATGTVSLPLLWAVKRRARRDERIRRIWQPTP